MYIIYLYIYIQYFEYNIQYVVHLAVPIIDILPSKSSY